MGLGLRLALPVAEDSVCDARYWLSVGVAEDMGRGLGVSPEWPAEVAEAEAAEEAAEAAEEAAEAAEDEEAAEVTDADAVAVAPRTSGVVVQVGFIEVLQSTEVRVCHGSGARSDVFVFHVLPSSSVQISVCAPSWNP